MQLHVLGTFLRPLKCSFGCACWNTVQVVFCDLYSSTSLSARKDLRSHAMGDEGGPRSGERPGGGDKGASWRSAPSPRAKVYLLACLLSARQFANFRFSQTLLLQIPCTLLVAPLDTEVLRFSLPRHLAFTRVEIFCRSWGAAFLETCLHYQGYGLLFLTSSNQANSVCAGPGRAGPPGRARPGQQKFAIFGIRAGSTGPGQMHRVIFSGPGRVKKNRPGQKIRAGPGRSKIPGREFGPGRVETKVRAGSTGPGMESPGRAGSAALLL